jgi:GTP cyclohydrolase II
MSEPKPTDGDVAGLTEDVLLARLEAMVPALRERAAETERLRHVPEATMAEARRSGFIYAFKPKYYGGAGMGLSALANGARTLAHGCASSAWTLVFLAQHVWGFGKTAPYVQDQMLSGPTPAMMAGALARVGKAERSEGGYIVSGRSDWNSGIYHADWAGLNARVGDELYTFYLPTKDLEIEDMWHTSGMRGTNSTTFEAKNVFVPDNRAMPMKSMLGANSDDRHKNEPFVHYPYLPTVAITCSSVVVGAAEAAVEHFEQVIRTRVLAFSGDTKQVEQPFAQMRLGEVRLRMHMARESWNAQIRKMDEVCGQGKQLTVPERVAIRGGCALVAQSCRDLINGIMNAAGGSSYYLTSPLQRIQRDVEVMKSHAFFDWDRCAQLEGRVALGFAPAATDLL